MLCCVSRASGFPLIPMARKQPSIAVSGTTVFSMRFVVRVAYLFCGTAVAFEAGGIISPSSAQAAQSSVTSTAPSVIHHYDIPSGPLSIVLRRFSSESNILLAGSTDFAKDKLSPGLKGNFNIQAGLAAVLAGTGLRAVQQSNGAYVLQLTSAILPESKEEEEQVLPSVMVQAATEQEKPYGPDVGYVARTSISGTKSNTAIIETPQSISVVTRQQMDDENPQDVSQALRYTPGVFSEPSGIAQVQNGSTGMVLRGFQADAYLDGLTDNVLGRTIMDPYLLERIEVVGGPDGALYGQGKPGGLVNMTSKLPLSTSSNEVQVGFGNNSRYETAFDSTGAINSDATLLYRLTGIAYTENTQTDFVSQKRVAIAPAITWKPDANTSFTLLGKYINDPDVGAYSAVPAYGTVLANPKGKIPVSFFSGDPNYNTASQKLMSMGYMFEHRFNDTWSVRQNFRFDRNETNNAYVTAGTLNVRDWSTLTRGYSINRYTSDNAMLDNQVQAKFVTGTVSHDVLIGLDYQYYSFEKYGLTARAGSFPSIDIFSPVYYQTMPASALRSATTQLVDQTQSQLGVYVQDQLRWNHWRFLLGGREDWTNTPERSSDVVPPLQNDHKLTWHTGLVYLFDNGLAPYFSYATSFSPNAGTSFAGTPFLPTTAQQYEIGLKYQPQKSNSFLTASIYNLMQQNVLTIDPEHPQYSVQTGEVRSRGIELADHMSLSHGLGLIAALSYNDSVNESSNSTATGIDGATVSTQGRSLAAVPNWMISVKPDYTVQSGPAAGLGMSAGIRYIGSSYGDSANSFKVPGYVLFDASLRYDFGRLGSRFDGFSGQINVTNLFNKTYVSSCTASSTCYFGIGRTIYASVTHKF